MNDSKANRAGSRANLGILLLHMTSEFRSIVLKGTNTEYFLMCKASTSKGTQKTQKGRHHPRLLFICLLFECLYMSPGFGHCLPSRRQGAVKKMSGKVMSETSRRLAQVLTRQLPSQPSQPKSPCAWQRQVIGPCHGDSVQSAIQSWQLYLTQHSRVGVGCGESSRRQSCLSSAGGRNHRYERCSLLTRDR